MLKEIAVWSEQNSIRQVLAAKGEAGQKLLYAHGYDIGMGFIDVQSQYQSLQTAARGERLRDLPGLLAELNKPEVVLSTEYKSALDDLLAGLEGERRFAAADLAARMEIEAAQAIDGGAITILFGKMKLEEELSLGTQYVMNKVKSKVNGSLGVEGEKNLRLLARRAAAGEMMRRGVGREKMGGSLLQALEVQS